MFENGGAKLVIDETSLDLVRCVARCFLHARYLSAHALVELPIYKALLRLYQGSIKALSRLISVPRYAVVQLDMRPVQSAHWFY